MTTTQQHVDDTAAEIKKPTRPPRPACAACKHQRRRCSPLCPLAPYFPAEKQTEFHNVHRLFGVCNIVRLLNDVPGRSRDDAMKSVIYEANFRAANPAGGCTAIICELKRRIRLCEAELAIVAKNLAFHRSRLMQQNFEALDVDVCENLNFVDDDDEYDDQKPFFINQECSSGRVNMDYSNHELDKSISIVQQFLNDKPSSN